VSKHIVQCESKQIEMERNDKNKDKNKENTKHLAICLLEEHLARANRVSCETLTYFGDGNGSNLCGYSRRFREEA